MFVGGGPFWMDGEGEGGRGGGEEGRGWEYFFLGGLGWVGIEVYGVLLLYHRSYGVCTVDKFYV